MVKATQNIESIIRKEAFVIKCVWKQLSHCRAAHLLVVLVLIYLHSESKDDMLSVLPEASIFCHGKLKAMFGRGFRQGEDSLWLAFPFLERFIKWGEDFGEFFKTHKTILYLFFEFRQMGLPSLPPKPLPSKLPMWYTEGTEQFMGPTPVFPQVIYIDERLEALMIDAISISSNQSRMPS